MSDKSERERLRRRRREQAAAALYEVGFAKPPRAHTFTAGNKMGAKPKRRERALDLPAVLYRVLAAPINVTMAGQRSRLARIEGILMRIVTDALQGDANASANLMRLLKAFPPPVVEKDGSGSPVDYGAEVRAKLDAMAMHPAYRKGDPAYTLDEGADRPATDDKAEREA